MSQQHHIHQAHLEFDFSDPSDAELFEQQASEWVRQQLLSVLESVFDEFCPQNQTIMIEELTLDLGELNATTFYEQAPHKLKQVLRTQLQSQLATVQRHHQSTEGSFLPVSNGPTNTQSNNIKVMSQQQRRWEILWKFLTTGALPWSISHNASVDTLGLTESLHQNIPQLVQSLSHTHNPDAILQRLIYQFSAKSIRDLFPSLSTKHQWSMMGLLLEANTSLNVELHPLLDQAWYQRLIVLLNQHDLSSLQPYWQSLIHQFSRPLLNALYQNASDTQLPAVLLHYLNNQQRLLLLEVIVPQEYPFLSALLSTSNLWYLDLQPTLNPVAYTSPRQSSSTTTARVQQQVWYFTLHYLLIERGSEFNRQRYMSGLVTHMANAQNQSVTTLLESLIAAIHQIDIDATLRAQLLDLLANLSHLEKAPSLIKNDPHNVSNTLRPLAYSFASEHVNDASRDSHPLHDMDNTSPNNHENHDVALRHINEWVLALCSGSENNLNLMWQEQAQSPWIAELLRWCGQLASVRRHWSETFSNTALLAFVDKLSPKATSFVRTVVAEKRVFTATTDTDITPPTESTTRISLWEFTFAFLIVETSSVFSRKTYLTYLIQHMAARRNITYKALLKAIFLNVAQADDYSMSGVTMRAMLEELIITARITSPQQDNERPNPFIPTLLSKEFMRSASLEQLIELNTIFTTLQNGDLTQWQEQISQWRHTYHLQLPLMIRELGQYPNYIQRWVTHFNDSTLLTLTELINANAKNAVYNLLKEKEHLHLAAKQKIKHTPSLNTRNALWEMTLHYLLNRQSSEFSQYQYLLNMTDQLAARYQVDTQVLILEWLTLADRSFTWRPELEKRLSQHHDLTLTAPQLLKALQENPTIERLSSEHTSVLRQYAIVNATVLAKQLHTWRLSELTNLIQQLHPQMNDRTIAIIPLLLAIVEQSNLALHWFYQQWFKNDCPQTPAQWLQRLLHQINQHNPNEHNKYFSILQQQVLSSHHLTQSMNERRQWLYYITPTDQLLGTLERWLTGKETASQEAMITFLQLHHPQTLKQWLQRTLVVPHYLERWLETLSTTTHHILLLPTLSGMTIALLTLRQAWIQLFASQQIGERLFWQALYRQTLLKGITIEHSSVIEHLIEELALQWKVHASEEKLIDKNHTVVQLLAHLKPLITSTDLQQRLLTIEQRSQRKAPHNPALVTPWKKHLNQNNKDIKQLMTTIDMPTADPEKTPGIVWQDPQQSIEESSEPVTLYNAGLVIAATYIPMLFQRLGLTNGHSFSDTEAKYHAIFCLQWMTNRTDKAPEYQLLLNKVLCGIAPSDPIPQQYELDNETKATIDGLLQAIIAHWKALGHTSIRGLQTTFIQREGKLTFTPKHWQLDILPGTFDMLLDQLPWSFQTIKYPWMDKPLFVTWR